MSRCHIRSLCQLIVKSQSSLVRVVPMRLTTNNILQRSCRIFMIPCLQNLRFHQTIAGRNDISFKDQRIRFYLKKLKLEFKLLSEKMMRADTLEDFDRRSTLLRYQQLQPIAHKLEDLKQKEMDMKEIDRLIAGLMPDDEEMRRMAQTEKDGFEHQAEEIQNEIVHLLIPPEETDDSDIILEVKAGVGGQEAMLFTAEIFAMYQRYADYKGWNFDIINYDTTDLGGVRSASANVSGHDVYGSLKYERGVHRVQRVPLTEKSGRIHTSTMTVAILPQPQDIDVVIDNKDLKIDTFRSSGKGGQHVNTTDSAVRITHIPTGTVVECQQNRSQIKNREMAMTILRSKIFEEQLEKMESSQRKDRKLQIGSAGRSEKIRTYNFGQDRITDHRIGFNTYYIKQFLEGEQELDDMIETLREAARMESLQDILLSAQHEINDDTIVSDFLHEIEEEKH